jgi:hypothetical protein
LYLNLYLNLYLRFVRTFCTYLVVALVGTAQALSMGSQR